MENFLIVLSFCLFKQLSNIFFPNTVCIVTQTFVPLQNTNQFQIKFTFVMVVSSKIKVADFSISLGFKFKQNKNVNIANFVYYGKTRSRHNIRAWTRVTFWCICYFAEMYMVWKNYLKIIFEGMLLRSGGQW